MAKFELKLPKMGESIAEATITNWLKQVGDKIELDEAVLEIATDKVDSEVPSEVAGILQEQLFSVNDLVKVGQIIAIIQTESTEISTDSLIPKGETFKISNLTPNTPLVNEVSYSSKSTASSDKFFSPLVRNIAQSEGISLADLENTLGSGKEGRVTKEDVLNIINKRKLGELSQQKNNLSPIFNTDEVLVKLENTKNVVSQTNIENSKHSTTSINGSDEIIEMDRMRKLISGYMLNSIKTSAHVQSFIEVDVTNIVNWRNRIKNDFEKREGEKLTYTPIFMEAVAKAIKDFPGINISVDGDFIIKKKNINLGMATALLNGNLIVPVIKNADQLNLVGMVKAVNDLAFRAKNGKLKPDDTQGGTYTVSNVGIFGSVFGTPIINQPQVGILALGAIRKVPAVIETPQGDFIGIRQKMFLSHSYDHRVIDGALGGSFVKRVAEYLEAFDAAKFY